jgi:RNA ligase
MTEDYNIANLPFSKVQLIDALEKKLVSVQKHPDKSLYIFNYTPLAQYSQQWNEVTKTCRGLILDDDYNIVARPFPKIFNYNEIEPDPIILSQSPIIHDKLDGSLGIIYKTTSGWRVSTRGSFTSDQAIWATRWLNERYPNYNQPDSITCLFEIIYPENRICVNYGVRAELVLIAAINNVNGGDFPLESVTWWNGSVVERITNINNLQDAASYATSEDYEGMEGVVCTWNRYGQPSFRLKIKHPEYVRLHGIIHSFSKKKVWESLANNQDFLELLHDVPDEFYSLVKQTVSDILEEFKEVEKLALEDYDQIKHLTSRKDFAIEAQKSKYASILFSLLDKKDYFPIIWKMIKPQGDI